MSFCVFAPNAEGQSTIRVGTEAELKAAIDNAQAGVPTVIALDKTIVLTETLYISANKDIKLISNSNSEYFKLIGAADKTTIHVGDIGYDRGGVLRLDGIIVTHVSGAYGSGAGVNSGGTLILSRGEISGNTNDGDGGGISNCGTFIMEGGKISGNTATDVGDWDTGNGGGVYNHGGNFTMTGGEISGNTARKNGGGIYNDVSYGLTGMVQNGGNFIMTGGVISGNTAQGVRILYLSYDDRGDGGGVYNFGTFEMTGGTISGNVAQKGNASGGGVYSKSIFSLSGGRISDNTATLGGGVYVSNNFTMTDGEISNNKATNGGGMYFENGFAYLYGGRIVGNTATGSGGGILCPAGKLTGLFIYDGVVFSDNRAATSHDRASAYDDVYSARIGANVVWTSPFTQGYNNYDIGYTASSGPQPSIDNKQSSGTGGQTNSRPPSGQSGTNDGYNVRTIAIVGTGIGIAIGIIAFVLFLRKKKK